ncbi:MAG: SDH family Clp fold serine proteinase [Phycisphaerae bacterium]
MPNWGDISLEIQKVAAERKIKIEQAAALVRGRHLAALREKTGRNLIAYYSGWLSKPLAYGMEINDEDKNGFMLAVHKMDRSRGLDLILHTPGGDIASTQSIVSYLHQLFGNDLRAIVPQIAMSAGTIIACSCRQILMGKQSNLGPIDPQVRGVPAYGVIREFRDACKQVKRDPASTPLWQVIVGKYHPTFLGQCENAIKWSNAFVKEQLESVMFEGKSDADKIADRIAKKLSDYAHNKTHSRHIHTDECEKMGLNVVRIESDQKLQDLILTVHHCYMHALANTGCIKIIENHSGVGILKALATGIPQQ